MEKVIISGIDFKENFSYEMNELKELAFANNMEVVAQLFQKLSTPLSKSYFGKGKVEEIKKEGKLLKASTLIVNDELTPIQIRYLEKFTELTVIDRSSLILNIFASRAKSKEAKLQVEVAKLKYQLPRLHTQLAEKLDQQSSGSSYSNRGSGEKKIELNRRIIEQKITEYNRKLKDILKNQQIKRKLRDASNIKTVALIGYTNSGKSTTMNSLLKLYGDNNKRVLEKNMLFATLDTSVRRLKSPDNKEILISDTVGFVSKLPHHLIKSFQSTLKEASKADLLIQVIDSSNEYSSNMIETTTKTLHEIGVSNIPMIFAYNKADLANLPYPTIEGNQITYSARDNNSIKLLFKLIKDILFKDYKISTYLISYDESKFLDELILKSFIKKIDYLENGTLVTVEISKDISLKFEKFLIK